LAVWLPAAAWLLAVLGATLSGYPGVICVTPIGWLLSLSVGLRVVQQSASETITARLLEAGLAGALLGVFQGLVFALVLAFASPLGVPEAPPLESFFSALIAFLVAGGASAGAGAALSSGIAALKLRRT
jgi:hypothetical protein